jgi:hypothetical protein
MASALGKDIFGYKRSPKPQGVFSSEDSVLIFGGASNTGETNVGLASYLGYLVQQWSVQYAQDVMEVFELGSNALFWVKGRPRGQGTVRRCLGAQDAETSEGGFLPKSAYDICDGGATMVLKARGGVCEQPVTQEGQSLVLQNGLKKGLAITMSGVVVTNIGFSMSVQDVRLYEDVTWRFAYMNLSNEDNLPNPTSGV